MIIMRVVCAYGTRIVTIISMRAFYFFCAMASFGVFSIRSYPFAITTNVVVGYNVFMFVAISFF